MCENTFRNCVGVCRLFLSQLLTLLVLRHNRECLFSSPSPPLAGCQAGWRCVQSPPGHSHIQPLLSEEASMPWSPKLPHRGSWWSEGRAAHAGSPSVLLQKRERTKLMRKWWYENWGPIISTVVPAEMPDWIWAWVWRQMSCLCGSTFTPLNSTLHCSDRSFRKTWNRAVCLH